MYNNFPFARWPDKLSVFTLTLKETEKRGCDSEL